jgi:Holliday junction resolvase RusA-like endonuclease
VDSIAPGKLTRVIEYEFFLPGRFKPYVRMTQRSKWVDPQAIEYLASKRQLQWQMREQMREQNWEMIPRGIPLGVMIGICPVLHNMDLDNQVKALLDAAQGVVFEDDRWVDLIAAVRLDMGKDEAFLLVRPLAEN